MSPTAPTPPPGPRPGPPFGPPPSGPPRPLRTPSPHGPPHAAPPPSTRGGCLRPLLVATLVITVVFAGLAAVGAGLLALAYSRLDRTNVGTVALDRPLAIPPLAEASVAPDGTRTFDLRVAPGSTELLPGTTTPTWGVNGPYLGPTVRATRGDRVVVRVTNDLAEDTTMHWHGMHLPAAMDGGPMQPIAPGTTWTPTWEIDQPAATLWYHPHLHEATAEQVYRGVAGMFIVDDPAADELALPHDYGVDDIPVIVQDKAFHDDGTLDLEPGFLREVGIVGDRILVNGTYSPQLTVTRQATRLRLLNASNARSYDLGFTSGRSFTMIATDSGLLPAPEELERLRLAPGERAEVVVTMAPGDDDVIRSFPTGAGAGFLVDRAAGADDVLDVLRLRADATLEPSAPVPGALVPLEPIGESELVVTRDLSFAGTAINGLDLDMGRIDATAIVDTAERWLVDAKEGVHVFHVHDTRFLVRSIDGAPPPPPLAGWKDTLWLEPHRTFELVMRFEDHADPDDAYMFHCHVLRHEDQGMMGQLLVVDERDGEDPSQAHDHEHEHGDHERGTG